MIRIIIHIRLTEFPFMQKKEWYPHLSRSQRRQA
jgi:hypothetical protein